ncbi:MAG TPA: DUF6529 family protein [Euzebyales bacterium]|nr:DUF6529 family protein [Euzebyales bacterium]
MASDAKHAAPATFETGRRGGWPLVGMVAAGALTAVALGVYARVHPPARRETLHLLFSGTLQFKVWTTTLILALAIFQLLSALRLYGRVGGPGAAPAWLGPTHRLSGTLAFIASLPVAFHCLWALGFAPTGNPRALAHSVLGCLFYGAIVIKVGAVRSSRLPGWWLPVVGGTVFAVLVGVWATSALWFLLTFGPRL